MVGEVVTDANGAEQNFLFTHSKFTVSFNGDQIIEVNLATENPVQVEAGKTISFTYGVTWQPTDQKFENRFEKYLDFNFFEHQVIFRMI